MRIHVLIVVVSVSVFLAPSIFGAVRGAAAASITAGPTAVGGGSGLLAHVSSEKTVIFSKYRMATFQNQGAVLAGFAMPFGGGRSAAFGESTATLEAPSSFNPPNGPTGTPAKILKKFQGIRDASGRCDGGVCTPPDVGVAAGPTAVFESVNTFFEVFSKTGTVLKATTAAKFFGTGSNVLTDPKVDFDLFSQRFFVTIEDVTSNSVLLAVSASSDPLGSFFFYDLVFSFSTGLSIDQPVIGVDAKTFAVSVNEFTSISFSQAEILDINKGELTSGVTASAYDWTTLDFSVHPAQYTGVSGGTTEVLVSTGSSSATTMDIFVESGLPGVNPFVAPSVTTDTISNTGIPPKAPQKGTTDKVNTDDARVQQVVVGPGSTPGTAVVSIVLNSGCIPSGDHITRSCIRLIQTANVVSTVLQDFDISLKGTYLFYPSVAAATAGVKGIIIVFGFSNNSEFPSIAVTGQALTDPVGSWSPFNTYFKGSVANHDGRFGDYFGAGPDGSAHAIAWVAGEYQRSITFGGWATFIAETSL
jgi:hypothetical protein